MMNLVLVVFGLFAYGKLGIDQFPNVDFPIVVVQTIYPGADPKTIEEKVLEPLEKGLNGIEGLETLSATAYPNLGQVVLQFKLERNGDRAAQDVRDKVSTLASLLPDEAESPTVAKFDVGGAPIFTMTLSSDTVPYAELSTMTEDIVRPALEQVTGVGRVDVAGQREREIQVRLNRARLQSFGLSPSSVSQAIQSQNIDIPSGRVDDSRSLLRIKTQGTLASASEIGQIVIPMPSGQKIRVEDVAAVVDTLEDEVGYSTANGKPAITLVLYKQSGGNTVAIADGARGKVEELKKRLPEGVKFEIFQDNSLYIKGSIDSVKFDLVLGAFLAIVIVMLFLHDWRATLISAAAIPTSVIATFAFIQYMGFTLNIMTTLGLTLAIGILVDDAIVVIENIHRHLEMGKTPIQAAKEGTSEIGLAALAITLAITAVFVPVAFMQGIIGRFFYQFGMTVAFSVLVSLFVAFTLTPMMSSRLLKAHQKKPSLFLPIESALGWLENAYRTLLKTALRFRWITVAVGLGVLVLSVVMLRFVPVAFFPKEDRSQFAVNYELPEGTSLQLMKQKVAVVDEYLRTYPGVKDVVMAIGANAERKANLARLDVNLVPRAERSFTQDAMVNRLRDDLNKSFGQESGNTGAKISLQEAAGGGGGRQEPIQVILVGNDFEALSKFANETKAWMEKNVDGLVDVQTTEPPPVQEVKVVTDPVRSADVGLSTGQVGAALRALYEGEKIGEIEDKGSRFDVRMKVEDLDKRSIDDVTSISIPNGRGNSISIASVADIFVGSALSKVERRGGQRQIMVVSNFKGADLNAAIGKIETQVRGTLPAGISLQFDGQAKFLQEAVGAMLAAIALAILLVFMVLCAQFESYLTPFVIMMSVPLAFSGAFGGLLLARQTMSIYSMIGLIMLIGLVVKNAILLIDFTLHNMREGRSVHDALVIAGPVRLRPILMTTAAMIGGMIPIAIGHGVGGEARAPMAVCVIGGLISSTVLTLVVVPCIFSLVEGAREKVRRLFEKDATPNTQESSVGAH
ncbi:MAG: efflux RND transporter permease subunit [Silvanigrellales bacterium]|nr:efflux RND transporter permease subunit [Silvanigrellales bacterium]